ncbi:MAG: hypothetical protein JW829_02135 [Pirellulales bacterium]|nr:hypothetical protein [Pirellulales bacterium]
MKSMSGEWIVMARVMRCLLIVSLTFAWIASDCAGIGMHGGGPRGGARGPAGGRVMGSGVKSSGPRGVPQMTGFGGGRPANMSVPRPGSSTRKPSGFDHGAIPGFSHATGPVSRPGGRPSATQLGNFLGLPGGISPQAGGSNIPRPGESRLPANPVRRTPGPDWPAGHAGNHPGWAETKASSGGKVGDRLRDATKPEGPRADQLHNWLANNPQRAQQWQDRGDQIRQRWADGDRLPLDHSVMPGSDWWSQYHPDLKDHPPVNRGVIPGSDWWSKYHPNLENWYYHHDWHHHGWAYWWTTPTWGALGAWFPTWGWSEPVYYDYGDGGNVVYQDENVYVNGQDVGTATEYAQSAAELATVDSQQAQATPADEDWLALGTFAVVTSEKETEPSRILQLAVDRQGIISGTMHNNSTNQSYVVQGRVDKETQRVAFTIGDKSDVVMETGLYNLTQAQTPVLVHYGTDRTENYLLVQLDPPEETEKPKTAVGEVKHEWGIATRSTNRAMGTSPTRPGQAI